MSGLNYWVIVKSTKYTGYTAECIPHTDLNEAIEEAHIKREEYPDDSVVIEVGGWYK